MSEEILSGPSVSELLHSLELPGTPVVFVTNRERIVCNVRSIDNRNGGSFDFEISGSCPFSRAEQGYVARYSPAKGKGTFEYL